MYTSQLRIWLIVGYYFLLIKLHIIWLITIKILYYYVQSTKDTQYKLKQFYYFKIQIFLKTADFVSVKNDNVCSRLQLLFKLVHIPQVYNWNNSYCKHIIPQVEMCCSTKCKTYKFYKHNDDWNLLTINDFKIFTHKSPRLLIQETERTNIPNLIFKIIMIMRPFMALLSIKGFQRHCWIL